MSKTTDIQVRCLYCKTWFKSAIWIGDRAGFEGSHLFGNQQQCPKCGKMTPCNKENFKARFEDGGSIGVDTI
jgi:hypothetical protein